jgi:hypothetical protein
MHMEKSVFEVNGHRKEVIVEGRMVLLDFLMCSALLDGLGKLKQAMAETGAKTGPE